MKSFEFHGRVGNRRVVSFGLRYDYTRREVQTADHPSAFLDKLRAKIAQFTGYEVHDFKQITISEYAPAAGIGWHRDKAEFADIVGVSLLSSVQMRFRKRSDEGWLRRSHVLEPRSVYVLSGEARQLWEHSIAPVASVRYSLTFRTLASIPAQGRRSAR